MTLRSGWLVRAALAVMVAAMTITGAAAGTGAFVRVKVDTANIRSGPGTKHTVLWAVEENFPLRVLEQRRRWLRTVDFIGDEGWIYAPLTDRSPAVVVSADIARVRAGAGTRYAVRYLAEWGAGLRVLAHKGSWLKVEHAEEGRGWVRAALVWGAKGS